MKVVPFAKWVAAVALKRKKQAHTCSGPHRFQRIVHSIIFVILLVCHTCATVADTRPPVINMEVFAPSEGIVRPQERAYRNELCLNGRWQFQPVDLPSGYVRNTGVPPTLPAPQNDKWDPAPIKIPSPWNVNGWGSGHPSGDSAHPYDPGSIYFPSYPRYWENVEMGWLRKSFQIPAGWKKQRLVLHFEAVAGECVILINMKVAGRHFDSWLPFDVDVTRLTKLSGDNELLIGVRAHSLFDASSTRYSSMRQPYPNGSETGKLVGIWQDVFLLSMPNVSITDLFVKPSPGTDTLAMDVTVSNRMKTPQTLSVGGKVVASLPRTDAEIQQIAIPVWKLGGPVLKFAAKRLVVPAGGSQTVTLTCKVAGKLKLWNIGSPNLYVAAATVGVTPTVNLDMHLQRFGWRQFKFRKSDVLLNGKPLKLYGDFVHPFGPFFLSRSYIAAWYRSILDFGGNCARLHAQVHPSSYLEIADELGVVVLDETSIFGSSTTINLDLPETWSRFADHYQGLVLRDRNHPSVIGYSVANEMFAVMERSKVSDEDRTKWYAQLADLALRARKTDSTRTWISCDGDEDLSGRLPVWSKHFGIGDFTSKLPQTDKPRMVGEAGGSYFARPSQLAGLVGDRAYESYLGRNEGLAADLYDQIIHSSQSPLAWFSASETTWFGLEHVAFGYREFDRLPDETDGVFFKHEYEEGKPGIQIERIPPFVCTLNPSWDPDLPSYKALPMFDAARAALTKPVPAPDSWRKTTSAKPGTNAPPAPQFNHSAFAGDMHGDAAKRLSALGLMVEPSNVLSHSGCTIVDVSTLSRIGVIGAVEALQKVSVSGGTAILLLGGDNANSSSLEPLLPGRVKLTDRSASTLIYDANTTLFGGLSTHDLDFEDQLPSLWPQKVGIGGNLVEKVIPALRASNTDWHLFNDRPENVKCAAIELYEQLHKPSGGCLYDLQFGKGRLVLCSLDYRVNNLKTDLIWKRLLAGAGIDFAPAPDKVEPAIEGGVLLRALVLGRFSALNLASIGEPRNIFAESYNPTATIRGKKWNLVTSPSNDRFQLSDLGLDGPDTGAVVYFSFWIKSPRALEPVPNQEIPTADLLCYAADSCRLYLNGKELSPTRKGPADYRTLYSFDQMPLLKGWNQIVLRVQSDHLHGDNQGSLAVRLFSSEPDFMNQLETSPVGQPSEHK